MTWRWRRTVLVSAGLILIAGAVGYSIRQGPRAEPTARARRAPRRSPEEPPPQPRQHLDESGFAFVSRGLPRWDPLSLESVRDVYDRAGYKRLPELDSLLRTEGKNPMDRVELFVCKALVYLYEGEPDRAYEELGHARSAAESDPLVSSKVLSMVMYLQGVAALRRGETENCVRCTGEGSCIFPLGPKAVHKHQEGSRLAVHHFTEYLRRHPGDLGVRWLLNLAYMTLGEYPSAVPPEYLLPLDRFHCESEYGVGKFREISIQVGLDRTNMGGGAIMDDFDNDGLLDLVVTSSDATAPLALYRNKGDGTFEDRSGAAGLANQLGGIYCVQTDYNNDGNLDIFVARGAWQVQPIRPSLLRNNGDGTFTDVTKQAGLLRPLNGMVACWADFDNDGFLDLFIGCDTGHNMLFRNKGDGTFEDVTERAGVAGVGRACRGACWGDFNGDGYPDLLVNNLNGAPHLYRNNRNGTFTDVAAEVGVVGPTEGFSCFFFDYDNDGWPDIYAGAYHPDMDDVVHGLLREPHKGPTGRLYHNLGGKRFEDVTSAAGLDVPMPVIGSNFADFDNDGYLDFYVGTASPSLSALIPKRMFRNIGGRRFADITLCSGTGHLQKGHAVCCGDWDRDGSVDLFEQLGGASPGDRFHNVLFQNPGQGNHWLTVKLVGRKTNRAAIGARLKAVTAAATPLVVYRTVTSGSSYGANPLQQTLGLGKADRVATLEVYWPTSGITQTFHDVAVNQAIEVTEGESTFRALDWKPIPVPR